MSSLHTPRGGTAPPATTTRRARAARTAAAKFHETVLWPDIAVEFLDLDQFDDEGNLRFRRYRLPATGTASPAEGCAA